MWNRVPCHSNLYTRPGCLKPPYTPEMVKHIPRCYTWPKERSALVKSSYHPQWVTGLWIEELRQEENNFRRKCIGYQQKQEHLRTVTIFTYALPSRRNKSWYAFTLPTCSTHPTRVFEAALYPWDGEAHSQVLHMAQRTVCSCQVILSPIVSNRTVNWRTQARGKQLQEEMHWIPAKAGTPKNCHHFHLCSAFKKE